MTTNGQPPAGPDPEPTPGPGQPPGQGWQPQWQPQYPPPGQYPPGQYSPPGQYPPGPPRYGYPPPPPAPGRPDHPQAVVALVLGLLGVVTCQLLAPLAWIIGRKVTGEIDASGGAWGGRSNAQTGMWLGIVGSVLLILAVLGLVIWLVFAVSLFGGTMLNDGGLDATFT